MSDLIVPNSFVADTDAEAELVNENFDAIKDFLNSTGVHKFQSLVIPTGALQDGAVTSRKAALSTGTFALTGGDVISGTTFADLTGSSQTIVPAVASIALIWATIDWTIENVFGSDRINDTLVGQLLVDGAAQSGQIITGLDLDTSSGAGANFRQTATQHWRVALTAASHTLKLQAKTTGGSVVGTVAASHSKWSYLLLSQ